MIESRLVWLAAAFVENTLAEGMNISTYSVAPYRTPTVPRTALRLLFVDSVGL